MNRREFVAGGLAVGIGSSMHSSPSESQWEDRFVALEWYRCRRDLDVARLRGFLGDSVLPALERALVKPVGVFQVSVGPDNPSFLVVSPYASLAAVQEVRTRLSSDEKWGKELSSFDDKWDLAYERMESSLLRAFKSFPQIEVPKLDEGKPHIFELRTYESRSLSAHEKKVRMFNIGEIEIFRKCGIHPVFFGSTVFGTRMPSLTYLVGYASWEARGEAWAKFGQEPEWKKLSATPGYADREIVSSISNQLLSPLPFSQIK